MSRRSCTGSEESQGWTSPGQPAKSVESAFGFAEYVARTTRVGGNFPPAGGLWLSLLEINPCAATPASGAARIARWTDVRHRIVELVAVESAARLDMCAPACEVYLHEMRGGQ